MSSVIHHAATISMIGLIAFPLCHCYTLHARRPAAEDTGINDEGSKRGFQFLIGIMGLIYTFFVKR